MWLVLIVVTFVVVGAAQRGGELYMHDPGPAEYLVSLLFAIVIVLGLLGMFRRL